MFGSKIDLSDILLGLLVAVGILYLFWKWIEKGFMQWYKWDRSASLSAEDAEEKNSRVKWFLTPNRWLADTYQPVLFWSTFYSAKHDLPQLL
jgi:hypothetical protein